MNQASCDGEPPEAEHVAGIAALLPRKRSAAGALIRDAHDRVLLVVPTYKDVLEIPGGVVEEDESPWQACRREVREEVGLDLVPGEQVGRLLVVDWVPRSGVWGDGLLFVFDGGVLDALPALSPGDGTDAEISEALFLPLEAVAGRVSPTMARRLGECFRALRDGRPRYLESGRPLHG